jgi:hypothetical protein
LEALARRQHGWLTNGGDAKRDKVLHFKASPAAFIGLVYAPDEQAAHKAAISAFNIRPADRNRLLIRKWLDAEAAAHGNQRGSREASGAQAANGRGSRRGRQAREMAQSLVDIVMQQEEKHQAPLLAQTIASLGDEYLQRRGLIPTERRDN